MLFIVPRVRTFLAASRAFDSEGIRIAMSKAMIAMTVSSSISVKPRAIGRLPLRSAGAW